MEVTMLSRNKTVTISRMMCIITISDVLCASVNTTVLLVSAFSGSWPLGDTICQMYGILALVLITASTWVLAIAALERYYKVLLPLDHSSMFTDTNTKILVIGAYLMMTIIAVNPLFGIGEYSYMRGNFEIGVNITQLEIPTTSPTFSESSLLYPLHCSDGYSNPTITQYLESNFDFIVRSVRPSSHSTLFTLQARDKTLLMRFWEKQKNGSLDVILRSLVNHHLSLPLFNVKSWIHLDTFDTYKTSHLHFQDLHICLVDFTKTSPQATTFTALLLVFSVLLPYTIMVLCYGSIYFHVNNGYHLLQKDRHFLSSLTNGSFVCLLLLSPYYVINISNSSGAYIPYWLNFISTLLLFLSHFPVVVCYFTTDKGFVKTLLGRFQTGVFSRSIAAGNSTEGEELPLKTGHRLTTDNYQTETVV